MKLMIAAVTIVVVGIRLLELVYYSVIIENAI